MPLKLTSQHQAKRQPSQTSNTPNKLQKSLPTVCYTGNMVTIFAFKDNTYVYDSSKNVLKKRTADGSVDIPVNHPAARQIVEAALAITR